MHPIIRRRIEAAARARSVEKPPRVWDVGSGLFYARNLPATWLEPICERVSRVQGEKFDRLVASIAKHGLANPLITVSELPEQNLNDWREYRYRFLYTIKAPIKVVVGHNRYEACKALGWTHVPVIHCGPVPKEARRRFRKLEGIDEAQALIRDGKLGVGPYSLVMDQFTPPLKGVPVGFEA